MIHGFLIYYYSIDLSSVALLQLVEVPIPKSIYQTKTLSYLMNTNNITIDVSNIKFCPGPCNCTINESDPIKITIHNNNSDFWYIFKPHSGGRYERLSYPLGIYTISLTNVRLCSSCNSRHFEFWEEEAYHDLSNDAITILKKLGHYKSVYNQITNNRVAICEDCLSEPDKAGSRCFNCV